MLAKKVIISEIEETNFQVKLNILSSGLKTTKQLVTLNVTRQDILVRRRLVQQTVMVDIQQQQNCLKKLRGCCALGLLGEPPRKWMDQWWGSMGSS